MLEFLFIFSFLGTAIRLAEAGFAIYGIDYEGHGKSDGLQGLVNSFDDVVQDCSDHFTSICGLNFYSFNFFFFVLFCSSPSTWTFLIIIIIIIYLDVSLLQHVVTFFYNNNNFCYFNNYFLMILIVFFFFWQKRKKTEESWGFCWGNPWEEQWLCLFTGRSHTSGTVPF